ncbi:MAG: hypothetical protein KJZ69_14835 [Phycisphaerales bacterium]|nr:hypothetical protein [Phycisphaerales bacterium]
MTYVVLILVAGTFGAWGYWRGGVRVAYGLAPLAFASALIWLLSGLLFRVESITSAGLAWPFILPMGVGLAGGYVLQFFARKRLPKEPHRIDRIAGASVCVLISVIVVWLGSLLIALRGGAEQGALTYARTAPARSLNNVVVRWIPAVGAGSDSLMSVVEIASADEEVRRRAAENLKIDHLLNSEALMKMTNDAATYDDLMAASSGNILALWRLQKNPLVHEFYRSAEVQDAIKRLTLEEIARAVREAQEGADEPSP